MGLTEVAISGPLLLAAAVAAVAGAVSFASPCVVPLVPGYLAYLAGLVGSVAPAPAAVPTAVPAAVRAAVPAAVPTGEPAGEPAAAARRARVAGAAALFVAGFTAVFGVELVGVVWLADTLVRNEQVLQRIGGVLTIAMGLVFVGLLRPLQREVRVHRVPRAGLWGAPLLGAVFGLGWTPCLGPTLTGVVAVAAGTGGTGARGVLLVLAYCAGLGVPFLLLALGAGRAVRALAWLRAHVRHVQLAGGALLIVVGVLLVSGLWNELVALLREPVAGFSTPI